MWFLWIMKGSGRNKPLQNVCRKLTSVDQELPFVKRTIIESELNLNLMFSLKTFPDRPR